VTTLPRIDPAAPVDVARDVNALAAAIEVVLANLPAGGGAVGPAPTTFVTVEATKKALGLGPFDTVDDEWLTQVVAATNTFVSQKRPDVTVITADLVLGSLMLATRWYSRRNGNEVAALNEFGVAPPAIDRDIETILGIGRAHRPVVA
jgi:hypothetical protein